MLKFTYTAEKILSEDMDLSISNNIEFFWS